MGLRIGFESNLKELKMVSEVLQEVVESLIGSIKVGYRQRDAHK